MISVLIVGLSVALPAMAEIEEIVVTATKREASIQDVPIAVTALSDQQLERAGVNDVTDLVRLTPSFNMNSSQTETGGTTLRIRGVGTTGNNIGLESAVGVFLDGVYLSRPGVALGELLDVEQIELLRGPQGTLFGKNTTAGAINVKTKKPNTEENEYWGNATIGNFSAYNVQAGANFAVNDTLAFRISGAWRERDGYEESTTGAESRTRDRYQIRAQALWLPTEDISLRVIADYADADERCCDAVIVKDTILRGPAFAAAGLSSDGGVPTFGGLGTNKREGNAEQFENGFEQWGISAELNWDLGWAQLVYIPSYREFESFSIQQSDFVNLDVFSVPSSSRVGNPFGTGGTSIDTMSHELRLQGTSDRFDWMVGVYYADEEISPNGTGALELGTDYDAYTSVTAWFGGLLPILGPGGIAALGGIPLPTGGTLAGVFASPNPSRAFAGGADALGAFAINNMYQDGTSWSIFTHNTIRLTDEWDFVIGLRYVNEEKDGRFEQIAASNDACDNTIANGAAVAGAAGATGATIAAFTIGFACFPFATVANNGPGTPQTFDRTFKDSELIYTLKTTYAISENVQAYFGFTHGFKAGGFNLDPTAAVNGADPRFDSELIDTWEAGVKSDLLDGLLRVNVSVFTSKLEDFQVLEFTGVQFVTFNVDRVRSSGYEIETLISPAEGLLLNAALTYADARYPKGCMGFDPTAPAAPARLCGHPLTNSARYSAVLGAQYEGTIPGTELGFFVTTNYRYESDRRTSTQALDSALMPNVRDVQEDNGKFDMRLGILGNMGQKGGWAVEFFGNNIFDKQTKFVTFNVPLRGTGALGTTSRGEFLESPRTYGVTFRVNY
jgi:outer membrane receptor protein involved in Fe transport